MPVFLRGWSHDLVTISLWHANRKIQRGSPRELQGRHEGTHMHTHACTHTHSQCPYTTPVQHIPLLWFICVCIQGYAWLKERLTSDEGKKQLRKIKELHLLADKLKCTAAQLAIGTRGWRWHDVCFFETPRLLFIRLFVLQNKNLFFSVVKHNNLSLCLFVCVSQRGVFVVKVSARFSLVCPTLISCWRTSAPSEYGQEVTLSING